MKLHHFAALALPTVWIGIIPPKMWINGSAKVLTEAPLSSWIPGTDQTFDGELECANEGVSGEH